jgi:RNA polymerase sigma factor for flagellar operon FliA
MGLGLGGARIDALWVQWQEDRDVDTRDELIKHYLPLVEFHAARFATKVAQSHRQDLYGFGVLGLIDAVDKFKPELGYRFETYGSERIRGAIGDGLRTLAWLPRRRPERRTTGVISKVVPMDFHTALSPDGARLEDWLHDPADPTPGEIIELKSDYEDLATAIDMLDERERTVTIEFYYGAKRLRDIAEVFGVSESRVCQIHRSAINNLHRILERRAAA